MVKPTGPWWIDPIGWSSSWAGTRRRVAIGTLSQVAFVVGGAVLVYKHMAIGFAPLAIAGVVWPYYFLSAMHELLELIPRGTGAEEASGNDDRLDRDH
jgi:hypothetical protein